MINFLRKKLDTQSKTLFKNSSWVFFANLFGIGMAFLRAIVIARGLGADLFGVFTIIVAFIGIVLEVLNLNLGTPLIRFGAQYKAENRPDKVIALIKYGLIVTAFMALTGVVVICICTFTIYDEFIKAPGLAWFAILYSIVAGTNYFNLISRDALRLYFKFKLNSIIQIIMDIAELSLVVTALLLYPNDLHIFLIAILISRFLNSIIPFFAAWRELWPALQEHAAAATGLLQSQLKEIRSFTLNNSVARTVQSLINNGDIMLIGLLAAQPREAAFYAIGKKLAWSILTLTDPLKNSIYPQFCKLYAEHQSAAMRKMLIRLTALGALPSLTFILIAYFFSDQIITLTVGKEYLEARSTFVLLTCASLLYSMFFWIQPLLQALSLVKMRLQVSLIGLATGIVSASILIPRLGSDGMAITMVLMNLVMPGFFIYFALRKLGSVNNAPEINA